MRQRIEKGTKTLTDVGGSVLEELNLRSPKCDVITVSACH